jgi:hypothetical protein
MMELLSHIVTFAVCAAAGYLVGSRASAPSGRSEWIAWLVFLFVARTIGVHTALISIFGFAIYINTALQGLIFGIIAQFLTRVQPIASAG